MKKILPFCQLHSVNSTFLYVENVVVKGFYAVKPYGKVELFIVSKFTAKLSQHTVDIFFKKDVA